MLWMSDPWMTTQEAAEYARVSDQTIRRWLKSHRLRGAQTSPQKGHWLVRRSDLDQFLETLIPEPDDDEPEPTVPPGVRGRSPAKASQYYAG
jgi:excisionase family DNA binding protein